MAKKKPFIDPEGGARWRERVLERIAQSEARIREDRQREERWRRWLQRPSFGLLGRAY